MREEEAQDKTFTDHLLENIKVRENDLFLSDARLDLPHSVNDRRETLTSFAALCFGVSSTLLRNLELALGMPRDMLTNMHSTTRANSNRIAVTRSVTNSDEVEVDVPALGAHRDAGSLTVLFNRLSGLQDTGRRMALGARETRVRRHKRRGSPRQRHLQLPPGPFAPGHDAIRGKSHPCEIQRGLLPAA